MAKKSTTPGEGNGLPPLALAVRQATKPSSGVALSCEMSSLAMAMRYATAICLNPKASAAGGGDEAGQDRIEKQFDKAVLPPGFMIRLEDQSLADARVVESADDLRKAVRNLGTHGGKVPDARLSLACAWPLPVDTEADAVPGVHSANVVSSHPLSGAGNAALNAQTRFLCMSIKVDGKTTSLANILSMPSSLRQALVGEFSAPAQAVFDSIGQECMARMSNGMPAIVESQRTQVFLPIDGGYVAASPLYPLCVGAELHVRLRNRRFPEADSGINQQGFSTRIVHVGGTKPQNTGMLATYLSGRFPRLEGMPPQDTSVNGGDVIRRFLRSGLPPAGGIIPRDAVDAFFAAYATRVLRNNSPNHIALLEAIGVLCDAALQHVSLVAREDGLSVARHGSRLLDGHVLHENSRDIALILGMLEESAKAHDIERVARQVASKVGRRLQGLKPWKGKPAFEVSPDFEDILIGVSTQKIQEFV